MRGVFGVGKHMLLVHLSCGFWALRLRIGVSAVGYGLGSWTGLITTGQRA